ncbi:PAS-domain containing protein [Roseomonas sp. WA12]
MPLPVPAPGAGEIAARAPTRSAPFRSLWEIRGDLAIILLILAMLWGAIGARLVEEWQEIERDARQGAANIAGAAEQGVARTIEAIDQRLRFARDAYARDPAAFSLGFVASSSGYDDGMMMQLALIDAEGRLRQTNLGPTEGTLDLSDRPHFRVHRERPDDALFISAPLMGRVSQRWSVQFTRKLYSPEGHFAGVVVCSLDPYWLTQFHELLDVRGSMLLIGDDGIVRAAAPEPGMLGQNLSGQSLGRAVSESGHGSLRLAAMGDMPEQLVSFRRLRRYPVTVAVGLDMAPLLATYGRIFQVTTALGTALTLLVLAAGGMLIRHKRRLLASRQVLRDAMENLDQGVVMVDRNGRILLQNGRYIELLDLPTELAQPGADYATLVRWQAAQGEFGPLLRDASVEELIASLGGGGIQGVQLKERVRPNGQALEIRVQALAGGGMVSTFTDITDRRRAEAEIHHLAHHDGLTDLANRTLLEERLTLALAVAERSGERVAVL